MNSHELADIIESMIRRNTDKDVFSLAEVTAISGSAARVKFDGETVSSVKYYPYMANSLVLSVGDRVVMARIKGGHVIFGQLRSKQLDTGQAGIIKILPGNSGGDGVAIDGGGRTIIGSGEAARTLQAILSATVEQMHVVGDAHVYIETDINNGVANRQTWRFDSNGIFYRPRYKEGNGYNTLAARDPVNHDDPMLLQHAFGTVSFSNSAQAFVDLDWPVAFNAAPVAIMAIATDASSLNYNATVYSPTATGCRVYLRHLESTNTNANINVRAIAFGRRA